MRRVVVGIATVIAGTLVLATTALAAVTTADPATVGPSTASGTAARGTFGIRLLEVTSSLRDDPRARQYIIDHLQPGTAIHRRVEVVNKSNAPLRLAVYPAAATLGDGEFHFGSGRAANELTTWTSTDKKDAFELAPYDAATVEVTIDVPSDASPGEHYGVIWAEASSASAGGGGVQMVNRVGLRMYLDIGPGGPAPTDFAIASLTARRLPDGGPAVDVEVRNTGGRALDLGGELSLGDGPGGVRAGPFTADLGTTIGPGESGRVTVLLTEHIPVGPWRATITLHSGLVERTAEAVIRFPDHPGSAEPVAAKNISTKGILVMSGIVGGPLLLVAPSGIFLLWRRRTRRT